MLKTKFGILETAVDETITKLFNEKDQVRLTATVCHTQYPSCPLATGNCQLEIGGGAAQANEPKRRGGDCEFEEAAGVATQGSHDGHQVVVGVAGQEGWLRRAVCAIVAQSTFCGAGACRGLTDDACRGEGGRRPAETTDTIHRAAAAPRHLHPAPRHRGRAPAPYPARTTVAAVPAAVATGAKPAAARIGAAPLAACPTPQPSPVLGAPACRRP